MDIDKFNEDYSKKLVEYINEYTIYLDDDEATDTNLIRRNKELQEITTNFIKEINKKSDKLDADKAKLDANKKEYNISNSELKKLQRESNNQNNLVVMLKKKEKNLIDNHLDKNKIIKPLFYVNWAIGLIVLIGALYITKNRLLLWFIEFMTNLGLEIYLSVGTLIKYIITSIFGMTKITNKNNNRNNLRNRKNRNSPNRNLSNKNSPITNNPNNITN